MKVFGVSMIVLLLALTSCMTVAFSSPGNLCFYPRYFDFGYKRLGETDSTRFSIWACCGCAGSITYSLYENCSWVEVYPTSGHSSGEEDVITVNIDTSGLPEGTYICPIRIESNSGEGAFTVKVRVVDDNTPPTVRIEKPEEGWLYVNDEKLVKLGFTTIVIGEITVEVDATDDKTEIEKVEIYIENDLVKSDSIKPYTWLWVRPSFGKFDVEAIAYDGFLQSSTDRVTVWKFF